MRSPYKRRRSRKSICDAVKSFIYLMAAYVFLDVKSRALKQGTHQLMGIPCDRIGSAKVNGPPLSASKRKIKK